MILPIFVLFLTVLNFFIFFIFFEKINVILFAIHSFLLMIATLRLESILSLMDLVRLVGQLR